MSEEYLTAEQATELLKQKKSTFYRDVKRGIYPFTRIKGRLYFPRKALEIHMQRNIKAIEPKIERTFSKATNAEIWERTEASIRIYGEDDEITYAIALDWLDRNDEIFMSARENGKAYGGSTIIPIDEPVILQLMHDKIRDKDIPLDSIRKWTDKNLSVNIPSLELNEHTGKKRLDRERAAFLLKSTIRWALNLHITYNIKNWYSVGVTPEGQAILEALGFKEFVSLENGERKSYKLGSLSQGSLLLKQFIRDIE